METAEAVVVGAGVIGASVAYQLARRGVRPLVLDRTGLAGGASGACDQAILLQSKRPGLHLELALASARMFQDLESELDADLEYRRAGGMIVVADPEHLPVVQALVLRQQGAGLAVNLLPGEEARRLQPALATDVVAATWSPEDAHVNPLHLTFAYARAARRLGARFRTGVTVTGLRAAAGRVTGVTTSAGPVAAPLVILAAGAWTGELAARAGVALPIRPRRGQILVTARVPPLVHGNLLCSRYLVAKSHPELSGDPADPLVHYGIGLSLGRTVSGNLLLGGCREFAGFAADTVPEVASHIARHATRLIPALAGIRVIRTYAGLRPYTPDGLPILGPLPGPDGVFISAGHEGDGIALAPITGALAAHWALTGEPPDLARPLGADRFLRPGALETASPEPGREGGMR